MRNEYEPGAIVRSESFSSITLFKVMMGTLLILTGGGMAIYAGVSALQIIYSEPPPLIEHVTNLAADKVDAQAPNQNVPVIQLAPPVMKTVLYFLSFLLLTLPLIAASILVGGGVKLMQGEANEVIGMLAERLKKSN
ncbi:hypothetical protein GC197_13285 [bacterium]|nr:hypothetical protein [bacterium]